MNLQLGVRNSGMLLQSQVIIYNNNALCISKSWKRGLNAHHCQIRWHLKRAFKRGKDWMSTVTLSWETLDSLESTVNTGEDFGFYIGGWKVVWLSVE